ncbi:hypothetical protein [Kitasatospora sp. A2-31]|nr:hypothetical protein [Kitasatospora sp. A2-31]MCG6494311.1 hypothetical protein [Kitasatospora sp. A2-31]
MDDIKGGNWRGALGCLVFALAFIAFVVFLVWAWNQPGGDQPSYWH